MNGILLTSVPTIRVKPLVSPGRRKSQSSHSPTELPSVKLVLGTVSRAISNASSLLFSRAGLTAVDRDKQRRLDERRQILLLRLDNAPTLAEWEAAAQELDRLHGNDIWKTDAVTGDYNANLIAARLKELEDARTNCDVRTMMHLIRTSLSRDLGGMGNPDLYRHCWVGTKQLIDQYVNSAIRTIDALVDNSNRVLPEGMVPKDLLEGMLYARQSFGRSALLLSGGATFGMSHIGVLKALFDAKLLPRIISGASAGSIVCSVMCTRTDEELPGLVETFAYGDLAVFEEDGKEDSVFDHLRRLLTEGSWSDIKHLTRVMRGLLGDITFQEAYNRTRRILNICVSTASIYELPRLLNYVTAPNVMIWSAVAASCSVPLVFSAAPLLVKNPISGEHVPWNPTPQRWIDGSVDNDLPMTRLAEMFNVNHFIVSQVNPHVVPFLARDDHPHTGPSTQNRQTSAEDFDWIYAFTALAKEEILHRMQFLAEIGIFPNLVTKLRSILSQKYSGDINILPAISLQDLPKILKNPTSDFMLRSCLLGERATWPKLSRIRDRCAIELALDRAVHRLRARVVFSASQIDLRRLATTIEFPAMPDAPPSTDLAASHSRTAMGRRRSVHGQRRLSATNLQWLGQQRHGLFGDDLTDDETEQEELEMLHRQAQPTGTGVQRKPRLKRIAKSQFNIRLLAGPITAPADEGRTFDFSRPLSPPTAGGDGPAGCSSASTSSNSHEKRAEQHHLRTTVISPTEELITSDVQSTDGDVESHTEESLSDPDPYEKPLKECSSPNRGRSRQAIAGSSRSGQGGDVQTESPNGFWH